MLLNNQTILITGGAQGIGLECAKAYIGQGANIAILDKNEQSIDKALKILGPGHLGIYCDVAKADEVEKGMRELIRHFGKLDVIQNNAAISHPSKALHETTEYEW